MDDEGQRCNKMDNKSFSVVPEECNKHLGFICERSLGSNSTVHEIKDRQYYIEPNKKVKNLKRIST